MSITNFRKNLPCTDLYYLKFSQQSNNLPVLPYNNKYSLVKTINRIHAMHRFNPRVLGRGKYMFRISEDKTRKETIDLETEDLSRLVLPLLTQDESHTEQAPPIQDQVPSSSVKTVPFCPKCGVSMVLQTASQGVNKGKQFFGCVNYPRCREIECYPFT